MEVVWRVIDTSLISITAVEANYGYSLNTQIYSGAGTALGVKSYSNEATGRLCLQDAI